MKKTIIIISAVMAAIAISLGLGLGLGLERNIKFDSQINKGRYTGTGFKVEIFHIESMEDLKEAGSESKLYSHEFFQKNSMILVSIDEGREMVYEVIRVRKKGKELKIFLAATQDKNLDRYENWEIFIEVNKWDLLGVQEIKTIFEFDGNL